MAAANATRRSRVEVTVYALDRHVEGTAWFGVPAHEQTVVARLVAGWPSTNLPMALAWNDLNGNIADRGHDADPGFVGGTRPPTPLAERSTDPALPADLREALTAVGRDLAFVVPLVDRGAVIGRLSVWSPGDGRPLAQAALLAVVALGEQAGLTVRAARRLAAAERRVADLTALLRLGTATTPAAPLPMAVTALARAALGIGGADGCAIEILLNEGDQSIVAADQSIAAWTHVAAVGSRHRPAEAPAMAAALRADQPRLCTVDDPALGPVLADRYRSRRARHLLIGPLALNNHPLGVVLLAWRDDPLDSSPPGYAVSPEWAATIGRNLADQLAVALDRLRHAAALRRRAAADGGGHVVVRQPILDDPLTALAAELEAALVATM